MMVENNAISKIPGVKFIQRILNVQSPTKSSVSNNKIVERENSRAEPFSIGSMTKGHCLLKGQLILPNKTISIQNDNLWQLVHTLEDGVEQLFDFSWLDDLAAVRNLNAVKLAQKWTFEWLQSQYKNEGLAWQSAIAGRRIIHLRHNEHILLAMANQEKQQQYDSAIRNHANHLRKHINDPPDGLSGIETLTGLFYAELAIEGSYGGATNALIRLAEISDQLIQPKLGILSRNPQELFYITERLQWCSLIAAEIGMAVEDKLFSVIQRASTILRLLRHANGSLARFHSGGSPPIGQLDRVFARANLPPNTEHQLAMGFVRMKAARTTLIADAAAPLVGKKSLKSHASTLAFELVVGNNPIIVNCGPGGFFGFDARQTSSHSTIEIDGTSSSRMNIQILHKTDPDGIFVVCPDRVISEQLPGADGNTIIINHNGYAPLFGITHIRRLDMNPNGDHVWGEDTLWASCPEDRQVFANAIDARSGKSLDFVARFHLHPEIVVENVPNQRQVRMEIVNGDVWIFGFEGMAELMVQPSVYFDELLLKSRQSNQIILKSSFAHGPAAQLRWHLRRTST